jgi:hypothetical protein
MDEIENNWKFIKEIREKWRRKITKTKFEKEKNKK